MVEVADLHRWLHVLHVDPQASVLATIIGVTGSAYRKAGATMLFLEDGTQVGLLSGGCLEADLAVRASEVMEHGQARTVLYDMRGEDDLSWGQGAGCNGEIEVLLEPLDEQLRVHLSHLKWWLEQGVEVMHAKKWSAEGTVVEYLFLTEHGQTFGTWEGEVPVAWIGERLGNDGIASLQAGALDSDAAQRVFVQHFTPRPRLVIFGAGPDAKPLVAFAETCGWAVIIADWRPEVCSKTHFPQATRLVVGQTAEVLEELTLTRRDSVVIMTHNFQRDRELLQELLAKELHYLGILGPRERTSRLLEGAEFPEKLRSPVGLAIGAVGAEEIAIAILADLIEHRRNRASNQVLSS